MRKNPKNDLKHIKNIINNYKKHKKKENTIKQTKIRIEKLKKTLEKFLEQEKEQLKYNGKITLALERLIKLTKTDLKRFNEELAVFQTVENKRFKSLEEALNHFNCYYTVVEEDECFKVVLKDLKTFLTFKEFLSELEPNEDYILNKLNNL